MDPAVWLMVESRLVGSICEVEATGFDLTRIRPARALAGWSRTMSLVVTPAPALPSVPASTLLAWHIRALRSWDLPCDEPEALAGGRIEWADPGPRIDLASWATTPATRVLFLVQTLAGAVVGVFANCPLSAGFGRRDPALKSAIFVLEHPTGKQQKWQLRDPNCAIVVTERFLRIGPGFSVDALAYLSCHRAPEFEMTDVDAGFISLRSTRRNGWSIDQILRWELWGV
jgi:hypothetical protein